MNLFQRRTPGDPLNGIPSELFNSLQDMLQWYLRERSRAGAGGALPLDVGLTVKNDSGDNLTQYAIVGIVGDPVVTPASDDTSFYGDTAFKSIAPVAGSQFAILRRPSINGEVVPAICEGVTLCLMEMSTAGDGYADCEDDNYTNLVSQTERGPARIIWASDDENGDGLVWALVAMSGFSPRASIIAHTAATFTIPAVSSAVSVNVTSAVDTTVWMVVGQTVEIYDGTHQVYGYISAIADATHFTFKTTRVAMGSAGNTMASDAQVIVSGDPSAGGGTVADWALGVPGIMNDVAQGGRGVKTAWWDGLQVTPDGGWVAARIDGDTHYTQLRYDKVVADADSGSPFTNYSQMVPAGFKTVCPSNTGVKEVDYVVGTNYFRIFVTNNSSPTYTFGVQLNPIEGVFELLGTSGWDDQWTDWSAVTTYNPGDGANVVDSFGSVVQYIAVNTNTNDVPPSANWGTRAAPRPHFAVTSMNAGVTIINHGFTGTLADAITAGKSVYGGIIVD